MTPKILRREGLQAWVSKGLEISMTPENAAPCLETLAATAVAEALGLPRSGVTAISNVDKYHEPSSPTRETQRTASVFELMRWLNERGLSDPTLGVGQRGTGSLRDVLDETLDDLAFFLRGRPVRYIELGPEPVKTSAILDGLLLRGVSVERYLGVDVNPASAASMTAALRLRLPVDRIGFRLSRYQDLEPFGRVGDAVNLVTMLGFEEGNEDPWALGKILGRIMGPGDLLLSELQLSDGGWNPIHGFYRHLAMRRFSRLSYESAWGGDLRTTYGVSIVPVTLNGLGAIPVAVAMEKVIEANHRSNGAVVVTNVCLKPHGLSFRDLRERCGPFRVLAQNTTGDRSIAFQLSDRRALEGTNALTRSWQDWSR
jgi:hypothetical protein